MTARIGIMQGRLVPPVNGKIQAFPAAGWRDEFPAAQSAGLAAIEWIYDVGCKEVNPICTDAGIAEMEALSQEHNVKVRSLCADYFMSEPLLKGTSSEHERRLREWAWLIERCQRAGISRIVLPFVDNSKVETADEISELIAFLKSAIGDAVNHGLEIHLESSLAPERLAGVLQAANHSALKVNYDSGNSASLGFDADEEFAAYGERVGSVHIKDRVRGGSTVTLGKGDADFDKLMRNLKSVGYGGDYILQVARGTPGDEINWARRNREFSEQLLARV
jgi:hexulose-6-phosphate isomerase